MATATIPIELYKILEDKVGKETAAEVVTVQKVSKTRNRESNLFPLTNIRKILEMIFGHLISH